VDKDGAQLHPDPYRKGYRPVRHRGGDREPKKEREKASPSWNTDNYTYKKSDGKVLYQSHPWIMAVRKDGSAYGILVDNTWKQEIDLTDTIKVVSYGPASRVIVIERKSPQLLTEAPRETHRDDGNASALGSGISAMQMVILS
jgi:hypothetical protein